MCPYDGTHSKNCKKQFYTGPRPTDVALPRSSSGINSGVTTTSPAGGDSSTGVTATSAAGGDSSSVAAKLKPKAAPDRRGHRDDPKRQADPAPVNLEPKTKMTPYMNLDGKYSQISVNAKTKEERQANKENWLDVHHETPGEYNSFVYFHKMFTATVALVNLMENSELKETLNAVHFDDIKELKAFFLSALTYASENGIIGANTIDPVKECIAQGDLWLPFVDPNDWGTATDPERLVTVSDSTLHLWRGDNNSKCQKTFEGTQQGYTKRFLDPKYVDHTFFVIDGATAKELTVQLEAIRMKHDPEGGNCLHPVNVVWSLNELAPAGVSTAFSYNELSANQKKWIQKLTDELQKFPRARLLGPGSSEEWQVDQFTEHANEIFDKVRRDCNLWTYSMLPVYHSLVHRDRFHFNGSWQNCEKFWRALNDVDVLFGFLTDVVCASGDQEQRIKELNPARNLPKIMTDPAAFSSCYQRFDDKMTRDAVEKTAARECLQRDVEFAKDIEALAENVGFSNTLIGGWFRSKPRARSGRVPQTRAYSNYCPHGTRILKLKPNTAFGPILEVRKVMITDLKRDGKTLPGIAVKAQYCVETSGFASEGPFYINISRGTAQFSNQLDGIPYFAIKAFERYGLKMDNPLNVQAKAPSGVAPRSKSGPRDSSGKKKEVTPILNMMIAEWTPLEVGGNKNFRPFSSHAAFLLRNVDNLDSTLQMSWLEFYQRMDAGNNRHLQRLSPFDNNDQLLSNLAAGQTGKNRYEIGWDAGDCGQKVPLKIRVVQGLFSDKGKVPITKAVDRGCVDVDPNEMPDMFHATFRQLLPRIQQAGLLPGVSVGTGRQEIYASGVNPMLPYDTPDRKKPTHQRQVVEHQPYYYKSDRDCIVQFSSVVAHALNECQFAQTIEFAILVDRKIPPEALIRAICPRTNEVIWTNHDFKRNIFEDNYSDDEGHSNPWIEVESSISASDITPTSPPPSPPSSTPPGSTPPDYQEEKEKEEEEAKEEEEVKDEGDFVKKEEEEDEEKTDIKPLTKIQVQQLSLLVCRRCHAHNDDGNRECDSCGNFFHQRDKDKAIHIWKAVPQPNQELVTRFRGDQGSYRGNQSSEGALRSQAKKYMKRLLKVTPADGGPPYTSLVDRYQRDREWRDMMRLEMHNGRPRDEEWCRYTEDLAGSDAKQGYNLPLQYRKDVFKDVVYATSSVSGGSGTTKRSELTGSSSTYNSYCGCGMNLYYYSSASKAGYCQGHNQGRECKWWIKKGTSVSFCRRCNKWLCSYCTQRGSKETVEEIRRSQNSRKASFDS